MNQQEKRLDHLLNAVKEMEMARLKDIANERSAVESRRSDLTRARREKLMFPAGPVQASELSNAERWAKWADREALELGAKLARLAALQEEQKLLARRALGRVDAFRQLLEKKKKAARRGK